MMVRGRQLKRIFVSSTFLDLQSYREKVLSVIRRLGAIDVAMEHFGAKNARPKDECLRLIREESDLFVGIFAFRYGYIPDGDSTSIVHSEYLEARKARLPCLIYMADTKLKLPSAYIDVGLASEKLREFKRQLQSDHICGFFSSPDDLAAQIAADVGREIINCESLEQIHSDCYPQDKEREIRMISDLKYSDSYKIKRAITVLLNSNSDGLIQVLKCFIVGHDEDLAEIAIDGLREMGSAEAYEAIALGLLSASTRIQKWSAFTLGELALHKKIDHRSPAFSDLITFINNPLANIDALDEVGHSLCKFAGQEALDEVLKILGSEKMPLRLKARVIYSAPKFFDEKRREIFIQEALPILQALTITTRSDIRNFLQLYKIHPELQKVIIAA